MSELLVEAFADLLDQPDDAIPLVEASLCIAKVEYPELKPRDTLDEVDQLVERAAGHLGDRSSPLQQIASLSEYLFEVEAFRGNDTNYYDPRNSCLNDVLDRRLGIPITLAVVYLEIANTLGFPAQGVSFPSHFLVKWQIDEGQVIVDPFRGGRTLTVEELEQQARVAGIESDVDLNSLLIGCTRKDILVRMLRNLWVIYAHAGTRIKQLQALNMLLRVVPDAGTELVARSQILESMDCHQAAIDDLQALKGYGINQLPGGMSVDAEIIRLKGELPTLH